MQLMTAEAKRQKARTESLYRSVTPTNIFNYSILLMLAIVMWEDAARTEYYVWFGFHLSVLAIRQGVYYYLCHRRKDYSRTGFNRISATVFLTGVSWGILAVTVHPSSISNELILLMIFLAMGATSASTYQMKSFVYWLFIIPAMSGLTFRFFTLARPDLNHAWLFSLAYLGFLVAVNLGMVKRYSKTINLQIEKDQLIEELQNANQKAEEAFEQIEAVAEEARVIAEKATAADRSKGRFLANISHEIRTPLNHVIGLTELVLENDLEKDSQDSLETVVHSAKSLLGMVDTILEFSQLEKECNQAQLQPTSLHSLVKDCLVEHEDALKTRGLKVDINIEESVPEVVMVDSKKLKAVLSSLISNSIKFTNEGNINIQASIERQTEDFTMMLFSVQDTGIGIAPEYHKSIFDSFFQVDTSSTREYGGTGIGLALAKGLVQFLGGSIWLESNPGIGSSFYFSAKVFPATLDDDYE